MIKVVKITSNGTKQLMIYLPTSFRDALHLEKGDYLKFYIEGGRLILEPLNLDEKTYSSMGRYLQRSEEEGGRVVASDLPGATERLQEQAGDQND
jgi:AbrB family looped-hinge helix DNA binding protein